jgi:hypothetical protein
MLGQPEPPIAQLLRVLRQPQRVPEGLRRRAVLKDGSEIENGQYQSAAPSFGVGFSTSRSAATPGITGALDRNLPFLASSIVGPSLPRVCKSLAPKLRIGRRAGGTIHGHLLATKQQGLRRISPKPLLSPVAGAGFEPATYGAVRDGALDADHAGV